MNVFRSIGLMSGTSMDGIDAVLLETDGYHHIKQIGKLSIKYEPEFKILLKSIEYAVRQEKGNLKLAELHYNKYLEEYLKITYETSSEIIQKLSRYLYKTENCQINFKDIAEHSTFLHEKVTINLIENLNFDSFEIDVIGYHGQALYHSPSEKITIQVGDGQKLANNLKIKVVNNFRINDIKNGGQGAPLAPLYHQALAVRDSNYPLIVLNCGGIANLTLISGADIDEVIGFDTGPGNVLVDKYIRIFTENKEFMDKDGKYGMQGKVDESILKEFHQNSIVKDGINYFNQLPPKSLDSGDCSLLKIINNLEFQDACATLEAFTAYTIIDSLKLIQKSIPKKWILAGGGWNNPVITKMLKKYLHEKLGEDYQIAKADEIGWDSEYMEAEIFAYLAVRSLKNLPISYPSTTKCKSPSLGGDLFDFN
ncbi:MAG: anhydro-N-acetylmuramic acid kinase [Alphaproteobacteria bacterium]